MQMIISGRKTAEFETNNKKQTIKTNTCVFGSFASVCMLMMHAPAMLLFGKALYNCNLDSRRPKATHIYTYIKP